MEVCIYKAKGKNGYLYDMSLNPAIDYTILKKTRDIRYMEIIADKVELEKAILILKEIYGFYSTIGKLLKSEENFVRDVFKRQKIKPIGKIVEFNLIDLNLERMAYVEEFIIGRVISLNRLMRLISSEEFDIQEIIDIVQALYCERRIKIAPFSTEEGSKVICKVCKGEECASCKMGFSKNDILLYAADNYSHLDAKNIYTIRPELNDTLRIVERRIKGFVKSRKPMGILYSIPNAYKDTLLIDVISDIVKKGGRVLYITSTFSLKKVKEEFKNYIHGAEIEIAEGFNYNFRNIDVSICSYSSYPCFHKSFDFVVLDLLSSFAEWPPEYIDVMAKRATKERGKLLVLSTHIENKKGSSQTEIIYLPVRENKTPLPEPRNLISRFLREGEGYIPSMLSDMIRWSLDREIKILIFIPDEDGLNNVYEYLTNTLFINREYIDVSLENEKAAMFKFIKDEIKILISMDVKDSYLSIEKTNVVVMYSDDPRFKAETLINMASVVIEPRGKSFDSREVLFVAAAETENIIEAKKTIREMNKVAWEEGFLRR